MKKLAGGLALALAGAAACGRSTLPILKEGDTAGDAGTDTAAPPHDASLEHDTSAPFDAPSPFDVEAGSDAPAPEDAEAGVPIPASLWVIGYFTSWDDANNGGFYPISAIDWDAITHVAAAYYIPDGVGGFTSDSFGVFLANPLLAAAHAHGKKVLAAIGGSGSGPAFESATQGANLSTFLLTLHDLLDTGYDGLSIEWSGGDLPLSTDQALEATLLDDLRSQDPGAIITVTAPPVNENKVPDLSFYGSIAPEVDRVNVLTYRMSGAYSGWESWHSSPLLWNSSAATPVGIDATVTHYLDAGVPAAKIGIAAGLFGECYTAPVTAPLQALGATKAIWSNSLSYRDILRSYYAASAYTYDTEAEVPYLTLSGMNAEGCTYLSYEDATSLGAKATWLAAQGLGGIVVWSMSAGYDQLGKTPRQKNPMLEAIRSGF